jgi:hypothetical protein
MPTQHHLGLCIIALRYVTVPVKAVSCGDVRSHSVRTLEMKCMDDIFSSYRVFFDELMSSVQKFTIDHDLHLGMHTNQQ